MALTKGLVHVYTGHGKGKTTAAFGLAVRALGQGLRVLVVQFLKGGGTLSGEARFLDGLEGVDVVCFPDQRHPIFCKECDVEELKASIRAGFALVRDKALSGEYDMVIMDEVNNCVREGWLGIDDMASLIREKPVKVELVLTGRGCPDELMELADYVTEMKVIKHPADGGVKARRGVEY